MNPFIPEATVTNPFFLPMMLMLLSISFYIGENIRERPNVLRAAVYVSGVIESFLYMTVVLG